MVLVHGGGSDSAAASWYRAMAPLAADREVWAIDLPGFGGSIDVPAVGGPEALAGALAAALATAGVDRAVVVGVSMGGDVALHLALEHPGRVAGLVLVAPGGLVPMIRDRRTHRWAWWGTRLPDAILRPAARLANRFAARTVRALVVDPDTLPAAVVEQFVTDARHPASGMAYGRYNQATVGRDGMLSDLSGRVGAIDVPTLFFHGTADRFVPPEGSVRAAAAMPQARIVLVPDCGHWAQLEAHDRFVAEVRGFLDEADL